MEAVGPGGPTAYELLRSKGSNMTTSNSEYGAPARKTSVEYSSQQPARVYQPAPSRIPISKQADSLDDFASSKDTGPSSRLSLLKKKHPAITSSSRKIGNVEETRNEDFLPPPSVPIPSRRARPNESPPASDTGAPGRKTPTGMPSYGASGRKTPTGSLSYRSEQSDENFASIPSSRMTNNPSASTLPSRKPRPVPVPKGAPVKAPLSTSTPSSVDRRTPPASIPPPRSSGVDDFPIRPKGISAGSFVPPDEDGDDFDRIQCRDCERKFAPEAFEKHSRICQKVFVNKRKVFNSTAMRVGGTDAAKYVGKGGTTKPGASQGMRAGADSRPIAGVKQSKWKMQHEQLLAGIRSAKGYNAAIAQGKDPRSIPMPNVPSVPDDRVPCPYCGRKFGDTAAERHIAHCKEQQARKTIRAGPPARVPPRGQAPAKAMSSRR